MAANNYKLALLIMMRELMEKTDEDHVLNASQIIGIMEGYGFEMDRRTVYANIEVLQDFGIDVVKRGGTGGGYYIAGRDFELPELKLLVDSVQSSKFITEKKSAELIRKLGRLINEQKAKELNRSVFIHNRMKTMNETIYYNVDKLHDAMNRNRQISFQYADWTPEKKLEPRKGGEVYIISPWALTWDDENYYLIGYDEAADRIKHYRVDKMMRMDILKKERLGKEQFKGFDLASFAKKTFGMYGGTDASVSLRCEKKLAGVVIDRFGKDIFIKPDGPDHIRVRVTVAVSPQFFGWITGIGTGMEIVSPESVREEYKEYLRGVLEGY